MPPHLSSTAASQAQQHCRGGSRERYFVSYFFLYLLPFCLCLRLRLCLFVSASLSLSLFVCECGLWWSVVSWSGQPTESEERAQSAKPHGKPRYGFPTSPSGDRHEVSHQQQVFKSGSSGGSGLYSVSTDLCFN